MRILSLLSITIATVSISLHFFSIEKFDLNFFFTIIGVSASAIAFLIGSYFSILAVNAYSHIQDIDSKHKQIDIIHSSAKDKHSEIQKHRKEFEKLQTESISAFFDSYTSFLEDKISFLLDDSHPSFREQLRPVIEKKVNSLNRQLALIALKYNMLDEDRRSGYVTKLFSVGEQEDIDALKQALENEVNDETRSSIKHLIRILEEKFLPTS